MPSYTPPYKVLLSLIASAIACISLYAQTKTIHSGEFTYDVIEDKDYLNFVYQLYDNDPGLGVYAANKFNPGDLKNYMYYVPDQMAVVNYLQGSKYLYIFSSITENVQALRVHVRADSMELYVNAFVNSILSHKTTNDTLRSVVRKKTLATGSYRSSSAWLYKRLIEPVLPFIGSKKQWGIATVNKLKKIPFAALAKNGDAAHALAEAHDLFLFSNYQSLSSVHRPFNGQLHVYANPDGSLPGADREATSIQQLFPSSATVYSGKHATIEQLQQSLSTGPGIIHFATHGVIDFTKMEQSYLVMHSGKQDAAALTFKSLAEMKKGRLNMIVLSACHSGVPADDKYAFSPADLVSQAGAKTVVASYWAVDDEATALLMTSFYKHLLTLPKLEALFTAMKELRKNEKYSHPYYWSAFYLVGQVL